MKKLMLSLFLLIPVYCFSQSHMQPYLNLEEAVRISDAAEAKAKEEGWNVVIVVLDAGGHMISLRRMDGVQIGSVEVAEAKGKSAVYFKRPTKAFEDMVDQGANRLIALPNAVPIEGGLPIFKDGIIVGAIGISGVTSAQDGIIAAAGLKAL